MQRISRHLLSVSLVALALTSGTAVPARAQDSAGEQVQPDGVEAAPDQNTGQAVPFEAEEEPVIADDAFEAALPELDENAPPAPAIPPIPGEVGANAPADAAAPDTLDADDAHTTAPAAGPAALPPAQDQAQDPAAPPIDDAALAQPLAPLETYDLEPVAPPTEERPGPVEEIRYYTVVEGFEKVGMRGEFLGLSALEEGGGSAENGAMLRARADSDAELAVRLLRSRGYYDAIAAADVALPAEEDGRYRVDVVVTPGQQYTFSDISIVGEDEAIPPHLVSDNIGLEVGDPVVADDVVAAEASIQLIFPFNGYPFSEIEQRGILLNEADKTADYVLPVDLGPRSRFRNIRTEGDLAFDAEHVELLSRFEEGDLYDVRMQDDLREAMVATSLFNSVSIEPVNTGEYNEDGTMDVDLLVRQQQGPPRSITGDVGYSTGQGFRAEVAWQHRNLFPPEGALQLGAVAGTREQQIGATFRRSNAGQRDRTFLLNASVGRRDFEAFHANTAIVRARLTRESTPIWQKRWTYALGAEFLATSETRVGAPTIFGSEDTYYIAALPSQIGYDASDSLLDPRSGWRATVRLSPEASLNDGAFDPYLVSQLDSSGYLPIGESFTLAGRVRLASINGIDRDDLAPSRRLYAGGGGSVRGYGFQDIGPRDEDGPLGARSLNEAAVEGRYRFGNFGVVAFLDAGQAYTSVAPDFSDLQYGLGVGGRYYTNFGPFRADIAIPLNRRTGQASFAFYVSVGQAF
ncbi:autotransporter assembly complex protein TamA [Pacificimonas flava]|uniref:Outer membrane protein n=1 Tax=Pacificimonas flava TaxID=1234595 RepID=M2U452_9SPHN|nr:BamA/TamA family outer membrane protein [Pacificimonas flava]EMD82758.1 outer membrane protein [Pacificimonas flava]MBB5279377.1 translocation and assembly module TamA [Pacificimonas flava]